MATIYVSNIAVNGTYVVGSDANNGSTPALAKLTIQGAQTAASANDTIYVNPGAGGQIYAETSGSGYFSITKILTIETDPAYLSIGKARLRSASASVRCLNPNANSGIFRNIDVDNQSYANAAVTLQTQTGVLLYGIEFYNVPAGQACFSSASAATLSYTIEKCTCLAANGNTATTRFLLFNAGNAGISFTLKGCKIRGIHSLIFPASSGATGLIRVVASSDGERTLVDGCTTAVRIPGTGPHASVDISGLDAINMTDNTVGYCVGDNQDSACAITSLNIQNFYYAGSQSRALFFCGTSSAADIGYCQSAQTGASSFLAVRNVLALNWKIHNNNLSLTSAAADVLALDAIGTGLDTYDNVISSDTASAHLIQVNSDGQTFNTQNNAAATGQANIGSASSNVYVYGRFRQVAAATQFNFRAICSVRAFIRKVGTPTGTLIAKIYTDNAGVPGTLVDTSTYALSAATLTSSQFVEFPFALRSLLAYDTYYHVRFEYSGTPDGANYFQVDYNANVGTTGSGFNRVYESGSSADGTTWSTQAARALKIGVGVVAGADCTSPVVRTNTVYDTIAAASLTLTHNIIVNGCEGADVHGNWMPNCGGIGVIFKLCRGTVTPVIAYNNLIDFRKGGSNAGQAYRDKGSAGALYYQNSAVITAGGGMPFNADSDFVAATDAYNPCIGGTPSTGCTVKNNAFYRDSTVAGYVYWLGNSIGVNSVTSFVCDHNDAYAGANTILAHDGRTGSFVDLDSAGWIAQGFGTGSIFTDPQFTVTPPALKTDFLPKASSPAKGIGANLSATVPNDAFGVAYGTTPTVGASNALGRTTTGGRTTTTSRVLA